jgi:hypothetical protein
VLGVRGAGPLQRSGRDDRCDADAADAARETLAGAVTVADTLDPATAEALRTAAAHAFDAGVGIRCRRPG